MPSRHARARLADDSVHVIRNRYMEAIRSGASIADATAYANADPDSVPTFTKSVLVEISVPAPKSSKREPSAIVGERELLLPGGWSGTNKPPIDAKAVDPTTEAFKRPMAAQAMPTPPVSTPAAVSAPVETQAPAESPTTEPAPQTLPSGWSDPEQTTWQELRALCIGMGLPAPNTRTLAVKWIRAKLAADTAAAAPAG